MFGAIMPRLTFMVGLVSLVQVAPCWPVRSAVGRWPTPRMRLALNATSAHPAFAWRPGSSLTSRLPLPPRGLPPAVASPACVGGRQPAHHRGMAYETWRITHSTLGQGDRETMETISSRTLRASTPE
jgi:hypothetical protein